MAAVHGEAQRGPTPCDAATDGVAPDGVAPDGASGKVDGMGTGSPVPAVRQSGEQCGDVTKDIAAAQTSR